MKKVFMFLTPMFVGVVFVVSAIIGQAPVQITQASTFVPCDPYDALCGLDCEAVENGVCGYYTGDGGGGSDCPAGQKKNASDTCICATDACCQAQLGQAYSDGNQTDGCACVQGATYNHTTLKCELPDNCPAGKTMSSTGNCICTNNACCEADWGAGVYDGNPTDGCVCAPGAALNRTTRVCEYCPANQVVSPTGYCVCTDTTCCEQRFGEAVYDGNDNDGCTCSSGAVFNQTSRMCELENTCPNNTYDAGDGDCICANTVCCTEYYGAAVYDTSYADNCRCEEGAEVVEGKCVVGQCPVGMIREAGADGCSCADDDCCSDYFGESEFAVGSSNGCTCSEGATWDGDSEQCTIEMEIVVEPGDFAIHADGQAEQEITAYVTDANGEKVPTEMWIDLTTPNMINPGELTIYKGVEGKSHTSVQAIYRAPEISRDEKTEQNDEILDLIYVFANINGEKKYTVITATLLTGEADLVVTVEKEGFKKTTQALTLTKSEISGTVFIMQDDKKMPINDAKITVALEAKEEVSEETMTDKDGEFNLILDREEDKGEESIELEMELTGDAKKHFKNGEQYMKRAGAFKSEALDYTKDFKKHIAEADEKEVGNVVQAMRLSAYTLYFIDYYDKKAEETMGNMNEYMGNYFKDTASFVLGLFPLTDAIFDIKKAAPTRGVAGLLFKGASKLGGKDMKRAFAQRLTRTIASGVYSVGKKYPRLMGELSVVMGAFENQAVNALLGVKIEIDGETDLTTNTRKQKEIAQLLAQTYSDPFEDLYKKQLAEFIGELEVDPDKLPGNLDDNIKRAEQVFKQNTEKHDYRNTLQYDWDVDTALATAIVDVGKGAVTAVLVINTGSIDPVRFKAISEAVSKVGNGFNLLKSFATMNHTFEWSMLYFEDKNDMKRSLSLLYTGSESLAWSEPVVRNRTHGFAFRLVPVVLAAPEMMIGDELNNIADAFAVKDETGMESYLASLQALREAFTERIDTEYDALIASFEDKPEMIDQALLTLDSQNELLLQDELMDLQMMLVAASDDPDNADIIREKASEFNKKEQEYRRQLSDFYEGRDSIVSKSDIIMWSIVILIVMLFILFVIKRNRWIFLLFFVALCGGGLYYYVTTLDWNSYFGGDSEQIDSEVLEQDSADSGNNDDSSNNAAVEKSTDNNDKEQYATDTDADDKTDSSEDKEMASSRVINDDYAFSLDLTERYAKKTTVRKIPDVLSTATYMYCVKIEDEKMGGGDCKFDEFPLFAIEVLNEEQFDEAQNSPFYDENSVISELVGLRFIISHPNGLLPEELTPLPEDFYGHVAESFEWNE